MLSVPWRWPKSSLSPLAICSHRSSALPAKDLATYQLAPRYYLFLGLALLTIATGYILVNSRFGLGMMAVREGEDAAESLGVSALKHKLLALSVSAFFAGLAGGAFAYYHVGYYPQFPFAPVWTFDAMMMAYIGGTGTIIGPIIGSVFFVILKEVLALKLRRVPFDCIRCFVHTRCPFLTRRIRRSLEEDTKGICPPVKNERLATGCRNPRVNFLSDKLDIERR